MAKDDDPITLFIVAAISSNGVIGHITLHTTEECAHNKQVEISNLCNRLHLTGYSVSITKKEVQP